MFLPSRARSRPSEEDHKLQMILNTNTKSLVPELHQNFSACLRAFKQLQIVKSSIVDFVTILAAIDIRRVYPTRWGHICGLSKATNAHLQARTKLETVAPSIQSILRAIQKLLRKVESLQWEYSYILPNTESEMHPISGMLKDRVDYDSIMSRATWLSKGREGWRGSVNQLDRLMEDLFAFLPTDEGIQPFSRLEDVIMHKGFDVRAQRGSEIDSFLATHSRHLVVSEPWRSIRSTSRSTTRRDISRESSVISTGTRFSLATTEMTTCPNGRPLSPIELSILRITSSGDTDSNEETGELPAYDEAIG